MGDGVSAKGIKRRLRTARQQVRAEICGFVASNPGLYGRALASEGYAGGYFDALSDVALLLDGVEPSRRRDYWRLPPKTP